MGREDQDNPRTPAPYGSPEDPFVGRVFNERFKIMRLVARGGSSAVYEAEQVPMRRTCAIKLLHPKSEGITPDEFSKRFFREASIVAKLRHPNNVALYDYGRSEDGIWFLAMEYLSGMTLAKAIRAYGPFPQERAVHVARQVCRALGEAHSLGALHRDIRPGNIFLAQDGDALDFVKVLNFGPVKRWHVEDEDSTQTGWFVGSPKYLTPEQIQGRGVDPRTDIYALGIVMYEMTTGRVPFNKDRPIKTLIAHVSEEPPPLAEANPSVTLSPLFEQIVYRCIAKNPNDRFGSINEVLHALSVTPKSLRPDTNPATSDQAEPFPASDSSIASRARSAGSGSGSGRHVFIGGRKTGNTRVSETLARTTQWQAARRRLWTAIGVTATIVTGAMGFLFVERQIPPAPVHAAAPASATTARTTPQTEATPAAAPVVFAAVPAATQTPLRIESTPAGASVQLAHVKGKRLCDATPCDVPRDVLPDKGSFVLFVVKPGFVSTGKTVGAEDTVVNIRIVPVPRGGRARAATPPISATFPSVYKDEPY
ncbi:MAG: protein kinase [Polyangiaceae bacterium]|nr:protein kinase [Polyangiaceae bacterium]